MLGIYLALIGAALLALADAFRKQLGRKYSYNILIWHTVSFGVVVGALASWQLGANISDYKSLVWLPVAIALMIAGEITFIKALLLGDLSEVAPIRAAAPVFSILLALVFFGELPTMVAVGGMVLVIYGVWMLTPSGKTKVGAVHSGGVRFMVLSQFLGVLTSLTIKAASPGISPLLFFTFMLAGELTYFSFLIIRSGTNPLVLYRDNARAASLVGVLWGSGIIAISIAPAYTLIAYAYASGQIYMPIAFVVSALILKEKRVLQRLWPMLIILAGVLLVIFGS